ncbi:MAG: hypothetical protein ACRBBU_13715 [Pseudooceanicola sp.]
MIIAALIQTIVSTVIFGGLMWAIGSFTLSKVAIFGGLLFAFNLIWAFFKTRKASK